MYEQGHEGEKVKGRRARTSTRGRGWPWIGAPPVTGREAASGVQLGVGTCEHQVFAESLVWLGGREGCLLTATVSSAVLTAAHVLAP